MNFLSLFLSIWVALSGGQILPLLGQGAALLTYTGTTNGSVIPGGSATFGVGVWTMACTRNMTLTFTGVGGGGGGGGSVDSSNGGSGGGAGASTTGTTLSCVPAMTYTLTVGTFGAAGANNANGTAGSSTTLVNTSTSTNIAVLPGGCGGLRTSSACSQTNPTVGSNLFTGGTSGRGGVDGSTNATAGGNQTSGAGGGGGGAGASAGMAGGGGNGRDQMGGSNLNTFGGFGGGMLFSGFSGGGGGGGGDINPGGVGFPGQPGGANLLFVSAP